MAHAVDVDTLEKQSNINSSSSWRSSPGPLHRSLSSPSDLYHRHAFSRSSTMPSRPPDESEDGEDDPLVACEDDPLVACLLSGAPDPARQPSDNVSGTDDKLQGSLLHDLQNNPGDMVPFTLEQIKGFREAMNFLDRDTDGRVDRSELSHLMRFLGHPVSQEAVDALLQVMSHGQDGNVGFPEFLATTGASITNKRAHEELLAAFTLFDTDGRGYLTPASLMAVMEAMGDSLTELEAAEMISEADPSCDGRLRLDAFLRYLQGPLPRRTWNVSNPKW